MPETNGFDYNILGWLVPSLVTLVTGIIAAIVAYLAISSGRTIAKKKGAIETIVASKHDEELRTAISQIRALHEEDDVDIKRYARKSHTSDNEAKSIRYALNFYEYLAIGINNKIYCDQIIKESIFSTATAVYNMCKPYIEEVRAQQNSSSIYSDFECLIEKWDKKPLKPARSR